MNIPIIPVSQDEEILIKELLHQHLPILIATIADASTTPQELRKARLSRESVDAYLAARPDENGCVCLSPQSLEALVYNIREALSKRCAAMVDLLHDVSFSTNDTIQIAQDSVRLVSLTKVFSDPSLPGTIKL